MIITQETITLKIAEAWLNSNKSNRKLREGVAERYADDMRNGKWTVCPEPISFYEDGDLADGQHRLWAIIMSNTKQSFPVVRGLPRDAGLNINTGLGRTLVDNSRISGADAGLSHELISAARACYEGTSNSDSKSNSKRLEMVNANREALNWAISNGPHGKYLRNAIIIACIARAWYHETDLDRLRRFSDVLSNGFMQGDNESAAVALRNYLLLKAAVSSSSALWRDTFLKVQNSIWYFMRGKKLTIIKGVQEEAYPIKKARKVKAA